MPTFVSILLSFGFALLYASILYWMDRYEKEPKKLLFGAFFWGAVIAAFVAMILNTIFGLGVFFLTEEEGITDLLTGIIAAPLVEESIKGLAVLIIFLFARSEFDNITDGIVYAGIVALGFAATENVLYLSNEFDLTGWEGLFSLFFIRVILGGWNHAVFTAFTGVGLAVSRMSRQRFVKIIAPLLGFAVAIGAHFMHNFSASMATNERELQMMFRLDWLSWLLMLILLIVSTFNERRWIKTYLAEEVSEGLLTAEQAITATSRRKRNLAVIRAPMGKRKATRQFYTACVEMAFKKHQRARLGEEAQHNTAIINHYRNEIRGHILNNLFKN